MAQVCRAAWRCSVFITWTEWTLAMALPWWQNYERRPWYYYYYHQSSSSSSSVTLYSLTKGKNLGAVNHRQSPRRQKLRAVSEPAHVQHVTKPGSDVTHHTSVASSLSAVAGHGRRCRRPGDDGRCTGTLPVLPASHLPAAAGDDDDAAWWTHGSCPTSGVVDDVIVQLVSRESDEARLWRTLQRAAASQPACELKERTMTC